MNGREAHVVREVIDELTVADRLIVLLHYADELSEQEIALVVERPASAIARVLREVRTGALRRMGVVGKV